MDAIEGRMSRWFGRGNPEEASADRLEPVEIRMHALREIARQVQPTGRGGSFFPYAGIRITLAAPKVAAAFSCPQFEQDLTAGLRERGCAVDRIPVTVEVLEGAGRLVEIEYLDVPTADTETERPEACVTVIRGKAAAQTIRLNGDRVYIGRLAEVPQKDGLIVRRNDVAFDESELTVSRKHAWIRYDAGVRRFRLFNDPECELGTRILRQGRAIETDSIRGVELRDGDEIHAGDARVRFDMGRKARPDSAR